MSAYVDTDYIIGVVRSLMGAISVPKYLTTKPTPRVDAAVVSEYIVINALKINADVMQKCIGNVNYHVKDIAPGVKDATKLAAGSLAVRNILEKVSTTTYLIDFESQETFREATLEEHYSNMRFIFKFINT
jgi:hypothetical protein